MYRISIALFITLVSLTINILGQSRINHLIISELLADPTPSQGLPEQEFLELFNNSDDTIQLEGYSFSDQRNNSGEFPKHLLAPRAFVIVTAQKHLDKFQQTEIVGTKKWPSLNNSGDSLFVYDPSGCLVFGMSYDGSEDGKSIELADLGKPCNHNAWRTSNSEIGGTPGAPNSIQEVIEALPFALEGIVPNGNDLAQIDFDGKFDWKQLDQIEVRTEPAAAFRQITWDERNASRLWLEFETPIASGETVHVKLNELATCSGRIAAVEFDFRLPEKETVGDIIFNEILTRPREAEDKFVELANRSTKDINLKGWKLARLIEGEIKQEQILFEEAFIFEAGGLLLLSEEDSELWNSCDRQVIVNLPGIPQAGASLLLMNEAGVVIDQFDYADKLHHPFIDNLEGRSLERISFGDAVWTSGSSEQLSTPGCENSQSGAGKFSSFSIVEKIVPAASGELKIAYDQLSSGNTVSVLIFSSAGFLVDRPIQNFLLGSKGFLVLSLPRINWRRDHYVAVLQVTDLTSNRISVWKDTFIVEP